MFGRVLDISDAFKDLIKLGYSERVMGDNFLCMRYARPDANTSRYHSHLINALFVFGHTACEDPRDKLNGLQGLVKSEEHVAADYTKLPQ
jgi:hypothetical protein